MKNKYRMSALIGCLIAIATAHATPPVTLPIGSVETMKAAAIQEIAWYHVGASTTTIVYQNDRVNSVYERYTPSDGVAKFSELAELVNNADLHFGFTETNDWSYCWIQYSNEDGEVLFSGANSFLLEENGDYWTPPAGEERVTLYMNWTVGVPFDGAYSAQAVFREDMGDYTALRTEWLKVRNGRIYIPRYLYDGADGSLTVYHDGGQANAYDLGTGSEVPIRNAFVGNIKANVEGVYTFRDETAVHVTVTNVPPLLQIELTAETTVIIATLGYVEAKGDNRYSELPTKLFIAPAGTEDWEEFPMSMGSKKLTLGAGVYNVFFQWPTLGQLFNYSYPVGGSGGGKG